MLLIPLLFQQFLWVIPVVLQIIAYFFLFRKMGMKTTYAIVPFIAEWRLSKDLFRFRRSYWRSLVVTLVFLAFAFYLNPFAGTSTSTAKIYLFVAFMVYGFFLQRLYWRLTGTFYDNIIVRLIMTLLTWLLPPLGLLIMAFGKAPYKGAPEFKQIFNPGPIVRGLINFGIFGVSLAEVAALVAIVGFFTLRTYPPAILINSVLNDTYASTKDVIGTGKVITREDTMGEAYASLASMPTSREKFFPDHSQDKSVVVMEYIVGADLEDKAGLASANITQMLDATKKGSGLTFVLECGGSGRWFTKGIADNSYGRYIVRDGKLEKVADLPSTTCMSEQQSLADFINWARDNYPADRYMLALWDHGGGLSTGYGIDIINKKKGEGQLPTLSVADVASAIAQSGMKFDVIGFDACLMQDLDTAAALEPYADYYLASEETEGGYGWFYTSAFGQLAANPDMDSEAFGREIVACYDPYNTIIKDKDGEPDTKATLSFVDLRYARAAFDKMQGLFDSAREAILADSSSYANLSLAGTRSYNFMGNEQIDLIDFLQNLDGMDYDDKIYAPEQFDDLIRSVQACVVYRNGDSAEGINGMAFSFPCQSVGTYSDVYKQLKAFSFETQENFYNDFFSIMAAQKKKQTDEAAETGDTMAVLNKMVLKDYTQEEWYRAGFENYESQDALIDIPLTETEDGYNIELPENAWPIIGTTQLIAYQKAEDGTQRYLGMEDLGTSSDAGHPKVAMDGQWVHIGGALVCYEGMGYRETSQGIVFTGKTKAKLNGSSDIILDIEWDPIVEGMNETTHGRVIGYSLVGEEEALNFLSNMIDDEDVLNAFNNKAKQQLKSGDKLDFLFDYYDEQGNLVKTETYGKTVTVVKPDSLKVQDEPMGECDVVFGGVLTDVYQRKMTTQKIEAHVSQ